MTETVATKKLTNNDFADVMFDRHSVRVFDPSVKISRDELQEMIKPGLFIEFQKSSAIP